VTNATKGRVVTDDSRTSTIGPVGRAVIANIERIRAARGISLNALSERLGAAGRPIGGTVLHRQSQGKRRVDADDLVAFAEVLGVTAADLLEPPPASGPIDGHPALLAARGLASRVADLLAAAGDPQATARAIRQADRAFRRVQLEIEELLAAEGSAP
jgi:transcriptional regulator with XRE-family HTH domain